MSEPPFRTDDAAPAAPPPAADAQLAQDSGSPYDAVLEIFRRLGPAGPLAILAASVPALTGFLVTLLPYFFEGLRPWMLTHKLASLSIYILGFTVAGGLAILPTWAHSVLGGYVFGFRTGGPAAIASVMGGAIVGYATGRMASGHRVVGLLEEHPKTRAVYDCLLRSSFGKSLLVVTLIRLPPSSPYAVTNLALASARVNPLVYILGTLFGIAPRTAIVVFAASHLTRLSFATPHPKIAIALTIASTMLVLGIIGYLANQAIARVTNQCSNQG